LPIPAQKENALTGLDQVADDIDSALDSTTHPAGEADNLAASITYGRDAVEGAGNTGTVVFAETADARNDIVNIVLADLMSTETGFLVRVTRLRRAAQVEDNLNQVVLPRVLGKGFADMRRQDTKQGFEVVNDYFLQ